MKEGTRDETTQRTPTTQWSDVDRHHAGAGDDALLVDADDGIGQEKTPVKPLSSMLLTIGQMPTGWSVTNSSTSAGIGCYGQFLEPSGATQAASASAAFENGTFPEVSEKLATYRGLPTKAFATIVKP